MSTLYKQCLFIDFDKTISPIHGFNVTPDKNVVDCVNKLSEKYKIVIFSCRANEDICSKNDLNLMCDYLTAHGIKYDEIYFDKPLYFAIIDDRSFNPLHKSWDEITEELMRKTT